MTDYGQNNGGNGEGLTVGDYANGMPNIRLSQIPASFARQLPWMLPAIALMVGASWYFTKDIKRQYVAEGRIMVKLGPEHVYDPTTGNKNSGITITSDHVVLTEIGIIKNSDIIDQVVNQMIASPATGGVGGEKFAPKLYEKWVKASPGNKIDRWNDIVKSVEKSYAVMPVPKSANVNLVYKHENGDVAVKTLDAFMSAYLVFRDNIFISAPTGLIAERRAATEQQLYSVERRIQNTLNKNGVSEFDAEQKGVQKRAETLRTQLNTIRGKVSATEAALAATEDRLRATDENITLYTDDRGPQRLAQAELERRQLLAKYLPSSNPVKAKEAEIAQLQAQIDSNGGKPKGGRRVGPNTVYQALMTQRNTYQAQADSFREQEATVQAQLNGAVGKVTRMRKLGPRYKNLIREKSSLEEQLKTLKAKEQVALVNQQQQDAKSDNIKIITRPSSPRKGRNMKKIMFVLAAFGSIFTVFMLALLRVFLDPRLYGPGPQQRLRQTPQAAPETSFEQEIPEPVPNYTPEAEPQQQPAYAPAAEHEAHHGPVEYNPSAYETKAYAETYQDQDQGLLQPYQQQQPVYADGSAAPVQQPYMSSNVQAYQAVPDVNAPQEYAGPGGDIPVLGTAGYKPYGS